VSCSGRKNRQFAAHIRSIQPLAAGGLRKYPMGASEIPSFRGEMIDRQPNIESSVSSEWSRDVMDPVAEENSLSFA
jgi:hypothetical protein